MRNQPTVRVVRSLSQTDRLQREAIAKAGSVTTASRDGSTSGGETHPPRFCDSFFPTHTHIWRGKRGPDPENTSDVFAPIRRGPSSRSGAVALDEPIEPRFTNVRGRPLK